MVEKIKDKAVKKELPPEELKAIARAKSAPDKVN